jgi:GT2 family glycosyltransferase
MTSVTLSIVTVSWNSEEFLADCISSSARSAGAMPYEHIVVDNASTDAGADLVERRFPEVSLTRNPENVGFARASNLGASKARGKYVLFLNPDTVVLEDALPRLVSRLEQDPGVGAVSAKLVRADGSLSGDNGYRAPTLFTLANTFLGLGRLSPIPRLAPGIVRSRDFSELSDCDWVSGACLMTRRELFERERWNEEIFFFGEDVEYCHRIRQRGLRVTALGDARVIHHSGASMSRQSLEFLAGKTSGIALHLRREHGAATAWLGTRIIWLGCLLRGIRHRLLYRLGAGGASLNKARRLHQYSRLDH